MKLLFSDRRKEEKNTTEEILKTLEKIDTMNKEIIADLKEIEVSLKSTVVAWFLFYFAVGVSSLFILINQTPGAVDIVEDAVHSLTR